MDRLRLGCFTARHDRTHEHLDLDLDPRSLRVGGTGKTGRRVAERLRARGLAVRIGSRAAAPSFDWDRRDTWEAALAASTRRT